MILESKIKRYKVWLFFWSKESRFLLEENDYEEDWKEDDELNVLYDSDLRCDWGLFYKFVMLEFY